MSRPRPDLTGTAGRFAAVLADALSDPEVVAGLAQGGAHPLVDVHASPARADVVVHLARLAAFDLSGAVDARDPLLAARRQLTPASRRDLETVEDALFEWMDGAADRPAAFAADPAAVLRNLGGVDPQARSRLSAMLGGGAAPRSRLAGMVVDQLAVDTVDVVDFPAPPAHEPPSKETTTADVVLEVGLDQLARVLDGGMVTGVRERASQLSFDDAVGGQVQHGVVSMLLQEASDPRLTLDAASPGDTVQVTIGFPEVTIQLGPGPLSSPVPTSVGAVEVGARLKLGSQVRAGGGGTTVALDLVPGSITVSEPANLSALPLPVGTDSAVRQQLWNAATAAAKDKLAPFYAFAVPLSFDTARCGIGPRGVTPAFRPSSPTTAPSLALFMTLLDSTPVPPPTDAGPSSVPAGADGHLLLSNGLVLALSCCLLTSSGVWGGLPDEPTERPTDGNPCCRWRDIDDVTVGDERFDTLKLLEICVEDGLRMYVDLRKSGFGWSARAEITVTATLRLDDGVVRVDTDTQVSIETSVAWWLKLVAVLAIVGGIVLIVLGALTGGNLAAIGVGGALVVLGLGMWTLVQLLPPDIRLPTSLDDTDAILDLLPGGLREKLGTLSFLTDASWDDVALSGFMTVPNEPALVAGGDVRLSPGQGLDLDTGEVVNAAEVPLRLDLDLVLHPGLREAVVVSPRMAAGPAHDGSDVVPPAGTAAATFGAGRLPTRFPVHEALGRRLAAFGSSRVVPLAGRPYPSLAESDLRDVVLPAAATFVSVPGPGSSPTRTGAAVFAARSSAGRSAKGVVWTDEAGVTWLRYRTYDTPLLLTIGADQSTQSFGKPGVTDIMTILNARFRAVPAGAWADGRPLTYQWYWQGSPIDGVATIDGGASMTVIDDRCTIDTLAGVDLRGALCVVASHAGGISVTSCRNVLHIGRLPKPPGDDPRGGFGGTGGPRLPGGRGPGLPGGPGPGGRPA